jgi:hypothetical protein
MAGVFAAETDLPIAVCLLLLAAGAVGVVTLFALALRSRSLAVVAAVLLLVSTIFLQPWHCFSPFEEAVDADPDVQSAAGMFRTAGVAWAVACVAVAGSSLVAFLWPKKVPPAAATPPESHSAAGQ